MQLGSDVNVYLCSNFSINEKIQWTLLKSLNSNFGSKKLFTLIFISFDRFSKSRDPSRANKRGSDSD